MLIYTIDRRRAGGRKEQVGRFVEIAVELCNAGLEGADTLPVKALFVALDDALGNVLEPFRGQHIRARLLDDIPLEKIFVLGFLSTSPLALFRPANIMPVIFTTAPLAAARHERRPAITTKRLAAQNERLGRLICGRGAAVLFGTRPSGLKKIVVDQPGPLDGNTAPHTAARVFLVPQDRADYIVAHLAPVDFCIEAAALHFAV